MARVGAWIAALTAVGTAQCPAGAVTVQSNAYVARIDAGGLTSLVDASGHAFVTPAGDARSVGILRTAREHWAAVDAEGPDGRMTAFEGLPGTWVEASSTVDDVSGDLVLTQRCSSPEGGVYGLAWVTGNIPLNMSIIVPGNSGVRLDGRAPIDSMSFDYPMTWEAQLVIVEGEGRGFYVWGDDTLGVFKRVTVQRTPDGWRLQFVTMATAPFEPVLGLVSVPWHVNVYEGDWRVPARRYRDWAEHAFAPTRVAEQSPAWVKDIRCCVIMGMDAPTIEELAARIDPKQTLLYIPDWRTAGYDRDYPTYDKPIDGLDAFLSRAHALGYHVMLHVNYFGCDPLHPLYGDFEPYQVRSPWGAHEKEWWLWDRADPIIKFAYINPAHKGWRELFIARMKDLCTDHAVDALHLDQTLCIFNDHNGLVDGMNMIAGNVALHRELREALPEVALSGEGLNEVTYRYEAFAQRHAWGINHADGTWDRAFLRLAHPISSYLLRPYTVIYGYLGYAPPTSGQLYAAWNEAYEHWGVIPTLKPERAQIADPTGFSRQFFDEARFWLDGRLEPDMDGDWPQNVCFPFRAAGGERVVRSSDHCLLAGEREISRTVTGVGELRGPGSIPGWRAYNAECIIGLDPDQWYPYLPEPRDMGALHVEALPEGFSVATAVSTDELVYIRTRQTGGVIAALPAALPEATCASFPRQGAPTRVSGALNAPDGGIVRADGTGLFLHPPWKPGGPGDGTPPDDPRVATVRAEFAVTLPAGGDPRFVSQVAMDPGAIGKDKTDGVTFTAVARGDGTEVRASVHSATATPQELELDLRQFAGETITLELSAHPGPAGSPTYDWARWLMPRIVREVALDANLELVAPGAWTVGLAGVESVIPLPPGPRYAFPAHWPGGAVLLREAPKRAAIPLDLCRAKRLVAYVSASGETLKSPQHATAANGTSVVGGIGRDGIFAHPPDHGATMVFVPFELPRDPAEFHAYVGLRDGAKSEGVTFIVEANGAEIARARMLPGAWRELSCDLAPWAGRPCVLTLITDSDGSFNCDWAAWGEPVVRGK